MSPAAQGTRRIGQGSSIAPHATDGERKVVIHAIRRQVWSSLRKGAEPSWCRDPSMLTMSRLFELTLERLRARRAQEDDWRGFLSGQAQTC